MSEVVCKLKHESDQRAMDLHMKVFEARLAAMDRALVLSAEETLRRLEELNHIKLERAADREAFLQKNIYDVKIDYYDRWIIGIEKRLTVQETRSILWTSMIAGGVVVLQIAIHLLWK